MVKLALGVTFTIVSLSAGKPNAASTTFMVCPCVSTFTATVNVAPFSIFEADGVR